MKLAPDGMSLAIGPELLAWLRSDPAWARLPALWRLTQHWRAFWGGLNARQSAALLPSQQASLQDPVYIIGPWRSGTTVMHELLSAATACPTPLTWQCMNAPAFRLLGRPPSHSTVARPMDGLQIGPLSPQEDEFALLALGSDSAYRGFLMPHRLPELAHTLDPAYWQSDTRWLATWEQFLRAVLATSSGSGPLLLKSPNHSFRLPALLARFPSSRYVWMARQPAAIFFSNRKMWRAMFATHGLTAENPGDLDAFLALALRRSAEILAMACSQLEPRRLVVCSQESIAAAPAESVHGVLEHWAWAGPVADAALRTALAHTGQGRIERYDDAALPEVAREAIAALEAAQQRALKSHGVDRRTR
jgi:hypothetical protein